MLLFVLALICAIYYATIKGAIAPALHWGSPVAQAAAALGAVVYSALVGLTLWSYLACFVTCPGHVPPGWHPFQNAEAAAAELETWERLAADQTARRAYAWDGEAGRAAVNRPRYCRKCSAWKPPRAHHDSMTGRCVLRMDHYCIWVLNCVGLLNYKHFCLFLMYGMLGCAVSAALLLKPVMDVFGAAQPSVSDLILTFLTFVFALAFSLALLGFVVMHGRLLATNMTTIEAYEKRPVKPWPYDQGSLLNFQSVFGRDRRYWALPLHTPAFRRGLLEDALQTPPPPDELLGSRELV
ncbi:putative S-acyltransferase 14 [Micractinium conductrix]|uniref:S-acyltransferase n=1 Tax=Micractinium conductrix TaxID=554055 RepID=A0A2P6VMG1_9CHLO|nr:putative S-acyltransferase 14 [Micractinium conductrix]|eukprot:PSC75247.1 putative S-acyltransferase 14 [Micractinium conductrix]